MAAQPNQDAIVAINVTPFVDVTLVLLIIFLATSNYISSSAIELDLPEAVSANDVLPSTLTLSLAENGSLFLDGNPTDASQVAAQCRRLSQSNPQAQAIIAADGAASHRQVIQLIDLVRQNGLEHFALNVEPIAVAE